MVDLAMLCGDGGRSARQYFGKEIADTTADTKPAEMAATPSTPAVQWDILANIQAAMLTAPKKLMEGGRGLDQDRMVALQLAMLEHPEEFMEEGRLVDMPLEHKFAPGLYVRTLTGLAGSLVVTEVHRTEHPYFMPSGHITVKDVGSGTVFELRGPCYGMTPAGTQRIVFAHEETVFITVHANPGDERDLDVIESRIFERRELPGGKTITALFRERVRLLDEGGHP